MSARQHGFTLIEMGVTLAIVGILLTGLIMTLGAQQDASRQAETRRYLSQAREALYGFAMTNGRLPCPAAPNVASGAANAGIERVPTAAGCTGGAAALSGVLPWATLGLAETDAYGGRISYRVDATFARTAGPARPTNQYACATAPASAPAQSAFAICSLATLTVQNPGGAGTPLASNVPAVMVSHGPNQAGGFIISGVQVAGGSADEVENSDADDQFRSGPRRDAGAAAGEFDDELDWVVPSILMHRMVQAGRLP
ncbi:type II secretion system protein [Pseudomarimonas salicorniae]|uniref:Type II secretion system GspH family protein n=1 Tax=Pseudomarimonas salicorniae TaxID=2933270 RepID=A0ABT0GE90_9GAMM|nr:type II secretion system protein [Lysobacter sp. CAU 1642]MCK7592846.1 type II secretion system GspH family protein [Lysobacter sp. CAU 1642]